MAQYMSSSTYQHAYEVPISDPTSIQQAYAKVRKHLSRTPLRRAHASRPVFENVWYKSDHMHWTGSFKERGVVNFLTSLSPEERLRGVIAASAGNHAQALAYHATKLGIPCIVVMPEITPMIKIEWCRRYGAHVIISGVSVTESKQYAEEIIRTGKLQERDLFQDPWMVNEREEEESADPPRHKFTTGPFKHGSPIYVHGYDHPHIVSGAGSCGIEIMDQLPDVNAVVIPVGGGGLIAGVSMAIKHRNKNVQVIGVETSAAPSFTAALKAGEPVRVPLKETIAEGVHVNLIGAHSFEVARQYVDEIVTIEEHEIATAILFLLEAEKKLIEGAGALGVAAKLSGKLDHLEDGKIVIVLTGGNLDVTTLGRVITRGMFTEKRLLLFTTAVSDQPGGLSELCQILASTGASVIKLAHERLYLSSDHVTHVHVVAECLNVLHHKYVIDTLEEAGFTVALNKGNRYIPVRRKALIKDSHRRLDQAKF